MKKLLLIVMLAVIAALFIPLVGCGDGTADLEDTKWILTSYGPEGSLKSPLADSQATVTFESETKEVTGNAGCNHYGGSYAIDDDKLTVEGPIAVTEMWCGEEKDAQEKEFLDLLLAAASYKVDGDTLVIDCGANVLNFERE